MANTVFTRKMEALAKEGSESSLKLNSLPPEDRQFLSQLLFELSRRDWAGDVAAARQQIIEVTREIAPDRLYWVTQRLALSRQSVLKSDDLP
jgi:hypothetical protein